MDAFTARDYCSDYFHAVPTLLNRGTKPRDKVVAALKIISYLTIVAPVTALCVWGISSSKVSKKMNPTTAETAAKASRRFSNSAPKGLSEADWENLLEAARDHLKLEDNSKELFLKIVRAYSKTTYQGIKSSDLMSYASAAYDHINLNNEVQDD